VGNAEHTFEINKNCIKTGNGSYSGEPYSTSNKPNTKIITTNNHEPGVVVLTHFGITARGSSKISEFPFAFDCLDAYDAPMMMMPFICSFRNKNEKLM
jgi:hypothetical protein